VQVVKIDKSLRSGFEFSLWIRTAAYAWNESARVFTIRLTAPSLENFCRALASVSSFSVRVIRFLKRTTSGALRSQTASGVAYYCAMSHLFCLFVYVNPFSIDIHQRDDSAVDFVCHCAICRTRSE